MYRRFFFVCILFVCFNSLSQSDYRFKNYTINDGLSQSAATTIIQDDNYSLWIGTQDGINRFDGKDIEVFEAASKKNPGLESQYIICSEKTSDGKIWFGTDKDLTVYDPNVERFKAYQYENKSINVNSISKSNGSVLWVATEKYGVLSFDLRSKKFKPLQGLKKRKKTHLIKQINKTSLLVYAEPYYNTSEFINFNPITNKYKSLYFHSKNGKPVIVNKFVQKNLQIL